MQIVWNKENNTIEVGKAIFTQFKQHGFDKWLPFAAHVLKANGIDPDAFSLNGVKHYREARNRHICQALGCSGPVLFKHFNKLQYKIWVEPIYPILNKIRSNGKYWPPHVVRNIWRHKEVVDQVWKDGLYNLLPVVVQSGLSPQQLKAVYKGKWKGVANNTLYRNKLLVKYFNSQGYGATRSLTVDCPSAILNSLKLIPDQDTADYLKRNFKGRWSDRLFLTREHHIFQDTRRMAEGAGATFNPKWTPARMHAEHARLTTEAGNRNRKHYVAIKPEAFDWLKKLKTQQVEHKGYVAKLLTNEDDIRNEGTAMHHCVGTYSRYVADKRYMVYSITKDGKRESTLGLHMTETLPTFSQQYKACNKPVTDAGEVEIAQVVLQHLRKEFLNE